MVLKKYQNPKGGLNAAGRAYYNARGAHLQAPVKTPHNKAQAARQSSFCARMSGVKGPMRKPDGSPSRKALALRAWHCGCSKK
jgi:Domain of unknown function (DUF6321)